MLAREQLQQLANDAGYPVESYEKAYALVRLLEGLRAHPFLGTRLALKGGTALNLFILELPRLSVDIDLNYIGAIDRPTMLAERPRVEQALEQVFGRAGLTVKKTPTEHAGGKWRLSEHELAAGKLAALVARSASRDLFDARELLRHATLNVERLRLGFVIYGGINREDWRAITTENVTTSVADVDSQLVPMLREDLRPARRTLEPWTEKLVSETRELVSAVLPLTKHELSFLDRLNGAGEIAPELLTDDSAMQAIIGQHPGLLWKAQNVRQHVSSKAKPKA